MSQPLAHTTCHLSKMHETNLEIIGLGTTARCHKKVKKKNKERKKSGSEMEEHRQRNKKGGRGKDAASHALFVFLVSLKLFPVAKCMLLSRSLSLYLTSVTNTEETICHKLCFPLTPKSAFSFSCKTRDTKQSRWLIGCLRHTRVLS